MLSRFGGISLKIARLTQIGHIKNSYSLSTLNRLQTRNYATAVPILNAITGSNLDNILKEFNNRAEAKTRLSKDDLQMLLTKVKEQKVDSTQALEILRCCTYARTRRNENDIVNDIWNELRKNNDKFRIQHYNCILQFARDKQDVIRAQELFDEMIKSEIKPDAISYQCLLSAYCKTGNIEKAIEVLEAMAKNNLYISEGSYNNLVECHVICGNIDGAKETMANLKESGFKVNYFTLEALLNHYAVAGDMENIEKTFELFKEENVNLSNRDMLNVMFKLAANGHAEKVELLFPHLKPTIELWKTLPRTITKFVQNNQSPIMVKILQAVSGNIEVKHSKNLMYLINEMVRLSTPEAEFNETIANIESLGFTVEKHFDIFKPALEGSSEEMIRKLLAHMKSRSMPVTENLFEKLFQLAAKKDVNKVLDVVNLMCSEYKIQPQISFVRDVILPNFKGMEKPALAYAKLQGTDIRKRVVVMAIISDSLNNGDLKTAHDFASVYPTFLGIEMIIRPLIRALATTGDVTNFVALVKLVHDSFNQINSYFRSETNSGDEIRKKQKQFVSETLFSTISNLSDSQLTSQLLGSFVKAGLAISTDHAEKIQKHLGVDDQTQIGRLLKKLTAESLPQEPVNIQKTMPNIFKALSSHDLQNILEVKQDHSSGATEKLLFLAYIREGNLEAETLLSSGKFSVSNSDYALLVELYTRLGKLENAINTLKRASASNASFKLDPVKVAKLVTLMVDKNCDFTEIEALLVAQSPSKAEFRVFVFEHLLDRLANNGAVNLVEKLFDALIQYRYIEATAESTGPIVVAHLKNGTLAEAVAKYEYFSDNYKLLPMTMVLFVHLIQNDQIDLLQRAFDKYMNIHNESAALCRLAFAFTECGQDRQARAIFENDNIQNLSKYVTKECELYTKFKRIKAAKTLLTATKGLSCDRHAIYQCILNIYQKENKAKEALSLWYDYSTENGILPQKGFKRTLVSLLKANKIEIPDALKE